MKILNDGLIGFKDMLWVKSKARKPTICWITQKPINMGDEAWRPLGNSANRFRRISLQAMKGLS
jgi:hypothetical protein